MDGAKSMAKLVVAVGVVSIGTAMGPVAWIRDALVSEVGVSAAPMHPAPTAAAGGDWFAAAKPYCNGVEARTWIRSHPYPDGWNGSGQGAACLALAGHVDEARSVIDALEGEARWRAAGVVFEAGHPAADAGDDLAAGPLMELVVEFWPNHYMALYHAGVARYERGDPEGGRPLLERFLVEYPVDDAFTGYARALLEG